MTRRDRQRQGDPEGIDGTFPHFTPGTGVWFRAHSHRPRQRDGGCWFYSSVPGTDVTVGGRFDLAHPAGSCYWASSEVAAARERLGRPGRLIAHDEVEGVRISRAEYDPGRLADLLASDAVLHGVTQELSSAVSYELAQRWAAAFADASFDGVRYQPRFTTERAQAVACFAASGRPRPARAVDSSRPMADVLQESGCDVLSHPSSRDLSPLLD